MLNNLDQSGVEHAILYSDKCESQNQDSILRAVIISFLCNTMSITAVEKKFFESGQSQMECDSIYSAMGILQYVIGKW